MKVDHRVPIPVLLVPDCKLRHDLGSPGTGIRGGLGERDGTQGDGENPFVNGSPNQDLLD
jgi:hypothetical protein